MIYHVDNESLPVCPVCGRLQPLEGGVFRYHDVHPVLRQICPGSKRTVMEANQIKAEREKR